MIFILNKKKEEIEMKKGNCLVIVCITVILLLFATCNKDCRIKRPKPKDVKPIDWENYNDVHTVYWNTVHCCSETISRLPSDTIMISGWKPSNLDGFVLCDYPNTYYGDGTITSIVPIVCYLPEFRIMLDTCDLTKKCFIKGIIRFDSEYYSRGRGCIVEPYIEITNIDDIYFK